MRFALVRFKCEPTKELPVGMGDIVGIGDYKSERTAQRYLWDRFYLPPKPSQFSGMDYLQVHARNGYTHFGLYEVPPDFAQPDKLVKAFKNPWAHLAPVKEKM